MITLDNLATTEFDQGRGHPVPISFSKKKFGNLILN